jgi:hypothetical protein
VIIVVAAIAALLALGALARVWFSSTSANDDKVFAGSYSSDSDLRVTNLTIRGGHVHLGYAFDVLFEPAREPGTLRCGLVDTSGSLDFFEGSRTMAASGTWTHLEFASDYDLPDITLGIRCSPSDDGLASIVFRDIRLFATEID